MTPSLPLHLSLLMPLAPPALRDAPDTHVSAHGTLPPAPAVVSLLFWGLANQIMTVDEAATFYPLFGMGANLSLIVAGNVTHRLSEMRATLPPGVDGWVGGDRRGAGDAGDGGGGCRARAGCRVG